MTLATYPGRPWTNQATRIRRKQCQQVGQPRTMHDGDYIRVFAIVERARSKMQPGQIRAYFPCPICGGDAWVLPREANDDKTYIGMCANGCWDCRE